MNPDSEYKPTWENRRKVIFLTLIFCAAVVAYLVVWGEDTQLNQTIANASYLLAAAVIGSYVFGAVWDDKKVTR